MRAVLGELTQDEWTELREIEILCRAIELNPTAFSKADTLDAVRRRFDFCYKVDNKHGIDPQQVWEFNMFSGHIVSCDE